MYFTQEDKDYILAAGENFIRPQEELDKDHPEGSIVIQISATLAHHAGLRFIEISQKMNIPFNELADEKFTWEDWYWSFHSWLKSEKDKGTEFNSFVDAYHAYLKWVDDSNNNERPLTEEVITHERSKSSSDL